jgi:hypothetical protein
MPIAESDAGQHCSDGDDHDEIYPFFLVFLKPVMHEVFVIAAIPGFCAGITAIA